MDNPEEKNSETWTEHAVEILPPVEDDLVSYERDRLQQIQENNRMLLALVSKNFFLEVFNWIFNTFVANLGSTNPPLLPILGSHHGLE
jgi:hypothetical protein